ncbi:MAG: hypothetical protein IH999_06945 [Proteobacteria bacterium]|nr:hypothetical protein [Pseudomonadota bacterium]
MTAKAEHGDSGVRSSIEVGAVLLRDEHGREIRLSWDKKKQAGETRALAPGRYKVVGYRMVKPGSDGDEWMITATSTNFGNLNVHEGQVTEVPVPKAISQGGHVRHKGSSANVMMVLAFGKGGVTIYRDGERIPMPFRVLDGSGNKVGGGNIEYG